MARVRYFRRVRAAPHVAGIAPPVNTLLPVITGNVAGEDSSTTNGTWTGSSTFTYQWYLDGEIIYGETAATITTDEAWAGQTLTVTVFAGNGAGLVGATSVGVVLTEGSAYTGPLDEVLGGIWGVAQQALYSEDIGNNVIRISAATDSDFATQADGVVSVSAIETFIDGGGNTVLKLYDQIGSADLDQVSGDINTWVANVANSMPGVLLDYATFAPSLFSTNNVTLGAANTVIIVAKGNFYFQIGTDSEPLDFHVGADSSGAYVYRANADFSKESSSDYTIDTSAVNLYVATIEFGSVALRMNGALLTPDSEYEAGSGPFESDSGSVGFRNIVIGTQNNLLFAAICSGIATAPEITAVETNLATRYGITLP